MAKSSISTMWAIGRFDRAADFVAAARGIGFDKIELNHQVTDGMLQEYVALQSQGKAEISSVHAPCPKWEHRGTEVLPELSTLDEAQRLAAVGIIRRAIDVAAQLKASAVVVHCGRVEISGDLERALRRLFSKGQAGTEEFRQARTAIQEARAARSRPFLEATIRSLKEVAGYAAARGLKLGLENRYHYHEIPLPEEMQTILDNVDRSTVFYWHDVGHAHDLELLGFSKQQDWLRAFRRHIVGMHLHDAVGLQDHKVAGAGEIDLDAVRSQVPEEALRVCEFASPASPEDVEAGYNYLKRLGFF